MRLVLGPMTDAHESQNDDIGGKIGNRMYRIGNHGGTVADNARHKLEHHQHQIDRAAPKGNFIVRKSVFS